MEVGCTITSQTIVSLASNSELEETK